MNDPLELHTGHQTIADALDRAALPTDTAIAVQRHLDIGRHLMDAEMTFVLSASADGDSLPQWARYPGYDGYAIGFRTHLGELNLLEDRPYTPPTDPDDDHGDIYQYVSVWRHVLYDTNEHATEADAFIDLLARLVDPTYDPATDPHNWHDLLVRIVTRLKNDHWHSEQEVRITATARDADRFHKHISGRARVNLTGHTRPATIGGTSSFTGPAPIPLPIAPIRTGLTACMPT